MTFIFHLDNGIMVKFSIKGEKSESVIKTLSRYTCYVYVEVPWYIGVDTRLSSLWPGFESAEGFFFFLGGGNLNKFCMK